MSKAEMGSSLAETAGQILKNLALFNDWIPFLYSMPRFNDRPLEERAPGSSSTQSGETTQGLIQNPDLTEGGKPRQHSIRDIYMARDVVRTIVQAGRKRSIVNSRILAKCNAERPYDNVRLENEGLSWRSNFTTKPLPTIVEQVTPRFVQAVQGLKYITNSYLSNKWENSKEKTEIFRKRITDFAREYPGWETLIEDISQTNALFGYNVCSALDEFSILPKSFGQDEAFVNDGTKQDPRFAQVVVLKETYMPHELFRHIEDREAAKAVGWDLEKTIEQINKASPAQLRDRLNVGGSLETWYQNAIRELTIGASYMAGANVIVVYSLLAAEVSGKVSHYRLAGPELELIFSADERFKSPEDCLAFFSYQKGNGTLHGSKGLGRDIYELAGMLDRTRNEIVDRSMLSGKLIVQGDIKRLHTFKMSLIGATCVIPNGWDILERKIDGAVEPLLKLDAYFEVLIGRLVGNPTMPNAQGGEAFRSPAAWNLLAAREEEGKDSKIARFMKQFINLVGMIQRRICDKDTSDKKAKEVQDYLLEKMSREELDELAMCPVAGTVADLTIQERQMIVALVAEKKGNPLYNQRAMEVEDITARLDEEFAERVLLPVNDPTEEAEQTREQLLEITLLSQGQPVPVSPRDNHLLHLKVLLPTAEQLASHIMEGSFHTEGLEAILKHISEHTMAAEAQGVPKEQLKDALALVKQSGEAIQKLKQLDAQAQQLQGGGAPPGAEQVPPGAPQPEAMPAAM